MLGSTLGGGRWPKHAREVKYQLNGNGLLIK